MKLLLLWHMHQPTYREAGSAHYYLPWVYLHTTKDYYEMPHLVEPFERVNVTFNLVPSLLEAIQDYAAGKVEDEFLRLFEKPPEQMNSVEQQFLIDNFFFANVERGIQPSARYTELYLNRGQRQPFSAAELRDLQVLFHLAWIGESFKREDPIIRHLVQKGQGFGEEDKQTLLGRMQWIFKATIGLYRKLWDERRIELSTTPYYHPILPLLCDTDIAKTSSPGTRLPETNFVYPDDARAHAMLAVEHFERVFGRRPAGFWPAEGSVSNEALAILSECGGRWAATDEMVLRRSKIRAGDESDRALMAHRGYQFKTGDQEIAVFFRDHTLSDLIGFVYQRWNAEDAVRDFMSRLRNVHERCPDAAVSVILDGENAWEGYAANAYDFLTLLYDWLNRAKWIETTTFSDYVSQAPPMGRIESIHPGSWIDANFETWIGHEEKNRAWVYLKRAREAVGGRALEQMPELARKSLMAAEGSDWFWWFGEGHSSVQDPVFDLIFRTHLKDVYLGLGLEPPSYLDTPVGIYMGMLQRKPVAFMTPVIDGRDTNYFEWLSAGLLSLETHGAMRRAAGLFSKLYFGFDKSNLYLRVDLKAQAKTALMDLWLRIELYSSRRAKTVEVGQGREEDGAAVGEIVEVRIPFEELGLTLGDTFDVILLLKGDHEIERFPHSGTVTLNVPDEDLEAEYWMV
jgi:alpha-amylase/alpha-mannosidase (GH57 family)